MRYPIFAEHLIKLARSLGVEQQDIAKRLKVPDSSVSLWATGARAVPRRHLPGFMAIIDELIRAHDPTHRNAINAHLLDWNRELYIRAGALSAGARVALQTLQSPYAKDDIQMLTREERQRLRYACKQLVQQFDCLDQFEQGAIREPGSVHTPNPGARFAQLRDWFGVDEGGADDSEA